MSRKNQSTVFPDVTCHLCRDPLPMAVWGMTRYCDACLELVYDPDYLRTNIDDPLITHATYPAMGGAYAYDRDDEEYSYHGI